MEKHDCPYCNSSFTLRKNLNKHLETALYCLQKRKIENIVCDCGKIMVGDKYIKKHRNVCMVYMINKKYLELEENYNKIKEKFRFINDDNERLNNEISFLKGKIESLERNTQARHTTINQYNQLLTFPLDLSKENIEEKTKKITLNVLYKGQKGLADFFVDYIATNSNGEVGIICTDKNRGNFKYMNENGKIVIDPEACNIIREFKSHSRLNINKSLDILWKEYQDENDTEERRDKFDTYMKIGNEVKDFGGPFVAQLVKRTFRKTEDGTLIAIEPPRKKIAPHRMEEQKVAELTPEEEAQFQKWEEGMN